MAIKQLPWHTHTQDAFLYFKDSLVLLTSLYRITMVRAWGGGYVCSIRHLSRDSFHASSDNRDGENKLCCHVSNSIWATKNIRSFLGFVQCFEKYVRQKCKYQINTICPKINSRVLQLHIKEKKKWEYIEKRHRTSQERR